MTAHALLLWLSERGVVLWREGDHLRYGAPVGVVTDTVLQQMRQAKASLLPLLPDESQTIEDLALLGAEADAEIEANMKAYFDATMQEAYRAACAGMLPDSDCFLALIDRCRSVRSRHGALWFETAEGEPLAAELLKRTESLVGRR